MTYTTLMVHLGLGHPNTALLEIAGRMADRFQAGVIGIASRQPMQMMFSAGFVTGDVIELERNEIDRQIEAAETEFRDAMRGRADAIAWRSSVTFAPVGDFLAHESRAADLVLTGVEPPASPLGTSLTTNLGDLVMQLGRPLLIVPAAPVGAALDRVIVGWKDTRETRRAVLDALPLLKKASQVTVVEIATEAELGPARAHVEDVTNWLKRHGITAEPIASASTGDDSTALDAIAQQQQAGIMVAGAYGHNRLREWVLGGVTRDALMRPARCTLVSH